MTTLAALEEFKTSSSETEIKTEIEELAEELKKNISKNATKAKMENSLAKTETIIEKIEYLKKDDVEKLEIQLEQTQSTLAGSIKMTKANLIEESERLFENLVTIYENSTENSELKEKVDLLKDELNENLSSRNTVANLRKTLQGVAPLLSEIQERKSVLKRDSTNMDDAEVLTGENLEKP